MASQRIQVLFERAEEAFAEDPSLSNRYVLLAGKISMRHRVRIPAALKRRVCRKCGAFLVPGASCRVRLGDNRVVTTCLTCGRMMRIPY